MRGGGPSVQVFIKESSHLSDSSSGFLNAVLSSQMFERFIEERIANPNHPQIKFFDESIIAKLNRSKTQLSKRETSFLDDNSDAVTEIFNPPPPSNWGLPDTGVAYTYSAFPKLRPDMFGNIRKPRRLFRFPEQQRTGSKSSHAHVLQRSLSQLEKSNPAASPPMTPRSSKLGSIQKRSSQLQGVIEGVCRFQATWRMYRCRMAYLRQRWATTVITRQWRAYASGRRDRGWYVERRHQVITIQKTLRRCLARQEAARRRAAVRKLQCWAHTALTQRAYRRQLRALRRIQAFARGRRARTAFLTIRELVINVQAVLRGWLRRRLAARERNDRLGNLRRQIFGLWKLAHTPLMYRSKFWMVFDGTGFLHLAIHEDEVLKLYKDLGFYAHNRHASFVTMFEEVDSILRDSEEARGKAADDQGRRLSLRGRSPRMSLSLQRSPVVAPNVPTTAGGRAAALSVKRNFDFNISIQFAAIADAKHLSVAAERLEQERHQLYLAMKSQSSEGTRDSFFHMFNLQNSKKRKRQLCSIIWQELDKAQASAQVRPHGAGVTCSQAALPHLNRLNPFAGGPGDVRGRGAQ
jgi:hypothetical protein